MVMATVTTKGQIVIPSHIRQEMNIKQGTRISIEQRGDELILRALTSEYLRNVVGVLGTKGKLCKALLASRAKDGKKDI